MAKQFLISANVPLSPSASSFEVAKLVLVAHDASELAIAAVADHLGVQVPQKYLMNYIAGIRSAYQNSTFPGHEFFRQLNDARISFKHIGNLPDPTQWHTVIVKTWNWLDIACQRYLGFSLDEIDLDALLDDQEVQKFYQEAKEFHSQGKFKEALEKLGFSLYLVLEPVPGIRFPTLGERRSDDALMLLPYGVRASEFFSLQEFLPRVSKNFRTGEWELEWETKKTGHRANWTESAVRFCLNTLLDIALKIQGAKWHPFPISYELVLDDVIEALEDDVELWRYEVGPFGAEDRQKRISVMKLRKGQTLRCQCELSRPDLDLEGPLSALLGSKAKEQMQAQKKYKISSLEIDGFFAYVRAAEVRVYSLPKENEFVRKYYPHLFS